MDLTKLQLLDQMCKHAAKENGLQDLFEFMIESILVAERNEFLPANPGNKGNGYVPAPLTAMAVSWNSVFPVTATAISIPVYLPYCAIRRRSTTAWQECFIQKALHRNR